jgi:hypothetical protein
LLPNLYNYRNQTLNNMATKTKVARMSDERYKEFKDNDLPHYGLEHREEITALEVYDNSLRIYVIRKCVGHDMFMGKSRFKYKYRYQVYDNRRHIATTTKKSTYVDKYSPTLVEKWS